MKRIKYLYVLVVFILSCTGKNTQMNGYKNNSESSNTISSEQQTLDSLQSRITAFVVHPLIPGRIITVGGSNADIQGFTSTAIQTAINALQQSGGGTIKLMPGNYEITAPVRLYSNMTLSGSGSSTVLKKCKGLRTRFTVDADYGELKITVADVSGFQPGMGIQIFDSENTSAWDVTTAIITAIIDNTIYIDNYLIRDYRADKEGTVSNACSIIAAVEAENVKISDLTIDGSRATNKDGINGCRGGGVYLHKVNHALVKNVILKDFATDGISWQITENIIVQNCEISGCAGAGLHPGTGSPFTLIEGNKSHDNDGYGLFICWRVQKGIVRNNSFYHNGINGISTGHKDSDMLFENNHIYENGSDGVNFRHEIYSNAPHRNVFKNNLVENNGTKKDGYGFSFNSPAEGIILENNTIRNTNNSKQLAAVYLFKNSLPVTMINNTVTGHSRGEIISE